MDATSKGFIPAIHEEFITIIMEAEINPVSFIQYLHGVVSGVSLRFSLITDIVNQSMDIGCALKDLKCTRIWLSSRRLAWMLIFLRNKLSQNNILPGIILT